MVLTRHELSDMFPPVLRPSFRMILHTPWQVAPLSASQIRTVLEALVLSQISCPIQRTAISKITANKSTYWTIDVFLWLLIFKPRPPGLLYLCLGIKENRHGHNPIHFRNRRSTNVHPKVAVIGSVLTVLTHVFPVVGWIRGDMSIFKTPSS
jgi:hypothetical protein